MIKLADAITRFTVEVDPHLDRQATIPIVTGPQVQGDVFVLPVTTSHPGAAIPAAGIPVIRGEAGGNTHVLVADGPATWTPAGPHDGDLVLGFLTVTDGAVAYLAHPEHGYSGIGLGRYQLSRQREYAGEWRMVAD
ncbi:hypothetical protein QTQ03_25240 [Micromonospora sp. WMMA1363]|uniref:hypothetical protein n=1 Tax=Micromonospora sp. WMMA1363 TaxID=3053985 RepID=UPI00259CE710|nr:hypothetical protein [Micromonospora sp. WMMA1363]MDM4722740.1 hypothetical protein [Micromonospora sp. WMMA1363]